MENGINVSRFKLYICKLLSDITYKDNMLKEIDELKKVRKNISSIITTNYDKFVENIFEFTPLIGNDILLSNPYGSVYKIHGCVSKPDKIIITEEDYNYFEKKYELIRAQLLSIFIHNPIIFFGYSITDSNIRKLLKTIFEYVPVGSELGERIKANFLIVEFDKGNLSNEVNEHDILLDENTVIRVNKIKTDDFMNIYRAIASLQLPVSAMDIRKVQNVVKEIYEGGSIQVNITEDIDGLENKDKVVAIGTVKTIRYEYQTTSEMMVNYFTIIEEDNKQLLSLIDRQIIQKTQYFPIFAFSSINSSIEKAKELKDIQIKKICETLSNMPIYVKKYHNSIDEIEMDNAIAKSNQINAILYCLLAKYISIGEVEKYLKNFDDKKSTPYRKLLCAYDLMKYADEISIKQVSGFIN